MKRTIAFGILLSAASLLLSNTVAALVTFNVNSNGDQVDDNLLVATCHTAANTCTLRAAVMQANRTNDDVTINVPAGLYVLGTRTVSEGDDNGDLDLTAPVSGNPLITITGAGANLTIVDGNQTDRVLSVDLGRTGLLNNLTLRNGYRDGTASGGGILNRGVLTLSNVIVRDNEITGDGGGIYNEGQLGIYDSTITTNRNVGGLGGGGITNAAAAGLTLVRSTIDTNEAYGDFGGGGILNSGYANIINSTVSQNAEGGIYGAGGGGIYNAGTVNVYNSTIVNNTVNNGFGGHSGAGIFNSVSHVLNLRNTIVAGNYLSGNYNDCTGTVGIYGYVVFRTATGCVTDVNSTGTAFTISSIADLGPLQDNGGPTKTIALVPPSPMIDGAPVSGCVNQNGDPLATDQRGRPRIIGASCDIGAFEYDERIFKNGFENAG